MFLYLLGTLGMAWFEGHPEWLLVLVILAGAGAACIGQFARRSWLRTAIAALVVEELFVTSALFGTYPAGAASLQQSALAVAGGLLALILASGVSLPDRFLPMQGCWLRRLLATVTLLALVTGSSWYGIWQEWWATGLPRWPLLPGLMVAGWLLTLAWSGLTRGLFTHREATGAGLLQDGV